MADSSLRPRHVIAALRHAAIASAPRPRYLVGVDLRFGKGLLRFLPPRVRDGLLMWWTGDSLTPASVLLEAYEAEKHRQFWEEGTIVSAERRQEGIDRLLEARG